MVQQPAKESDSRVVAQLEPIRRCSNCKSVRLGLVAYKGPFWRKECLDCRSTGPFELIGEQ